MRIVNTSQTRPSEEEIHARVKFLSLLQWTQANRYSYSAMEWRMTQSVFDSVFQRDFDTYFLVGAAFACPWRERTRGRLRQFAWPMICGLWVAELATCSWESKHGRKFCSQVFWDSVVFLDSPLGAASRKIEEVYNFSRGGPPLMAGWIHHHDVFQPSVKILDKQYPSTSPDAEEGQSKSSKSKKESSGASKTPMKRLSTGADNPLHHHRRESLLERMISVALLRSTMTSLFAGSAINEPLSTRIEYNKHSGSGKLPLPLDKGPNSSSKEFSLFGGITSTSSEAGNPKGGMESLPAQSKDTIELFNVCVSTRFFHWNPICVTRTPIYKKETKKPAGDQKSSSKTKSGSDKKKEAQSNKKEKDAAAVAKEKNEEGASGKKEEEEVEYQLMANSLSLVIPATVGSTIPYASMVLANSRNLSRCWYQLHMNIYSLWYPPYLQPPPSAAGGGAPSPPPPSSV